MGAGQKRGWQQVCQMLDSSKYLADKYSTTFITFQAWLVPGKIFEVGLLIPVFLANSGKDGGKEMLTVCCHIFSQYSNAIPVYSFLTLFINTMSINKFLLKAYL
jgi:hypothetical protein